MQDLAWNTISFDKFAINLQNKQKLFIFLQQVISELHSSKYASCDLAKNFAIGPFDNRTL